MKINCNICGKEFKIKPSAIKRGRKFCSNVCYGKWKSKNIIGKNSPCYKNKVNRTCPICKTNFSIHASLIKNINCCSIKCKNKYYSLNNKKDKNPNWRGGISNYSHLIRTSNETMLWRQKVFIKDNFTCQKCKDSSGGNLNAHHIKPFKKLLLESQEYMPLLNHYDAAMIYTPMWDIKNGITLCKKCHIEAHRKR
jgi:5-methylcytosine-specific restriction endonuclease McrA